MIRQFLHISLHLYCGSMCKIVTFDIEEQNHTDNNIHKSATTNPQTLCEMIPMLCRVRAGTCNGRHVDWMAAMVTTPESTFPKCQAPLFRIPSLWQLVVMKYVRAFVNRTYSNRNTIGISSWGDDWIYSGNERILYTQMLYERWRIYDMRCSVMKLHMVHDGYSV